MPVKHSINHKVWIKNRQDVAKQAARVAAVVAREFAKKNFADQQFNDVGSTKWQPRKNNRDSNRALLVKTGFLKRGFRTVVRGTRSAVINNAAYANIHNQGGKITGTHNIRQHSRRGGTVRQHTRTVNITIPKRQFIGNSHVLHALIRTTITKLLVR